HDSARAGAQALPGMGFTSASWRAYRVRNGVITPGVSAGSNHVGASVTVMANVICPAGASERPSGPAAGIGTGRTTAMVRARATADASDERRVMDVDPPGAIVGWIVHLHAACLNSPSVVSCPGLIGARRSDAIRSSRPHRAARLAALPGHDDVRPAMRR